MDGYVRISRKLFKSDRFGPEPFTKREAWIWLIVRASHNDYSGTFQGRPYSLQRGQLAYSVRWLADKWKWDASRVRRFLDALKSDKGIDTLTDKGGDKGVSILTIRNYNEYQPEGQASDKASDKGADKGRDTQTNTHLTNTPVTKSMARATRLPDDWTLPVEWRLWAEKEFPDGDITRIADKFRDYWLSLGGARSRKTDWFRTWCNWIRTEHDRAPRKPSVEQSGGRIAAIFEAANERR